MKKGLMNLFFLIIILVLVTCQNKSKSEIKNLVYEYGKFTQNASVFLFGDNVNIRNKPSLDSEILDTLPAGYKVKVLECTETEYKLSGFKSNWYKISFIAKDGHMQTGYIWGGFLAPCALESDMDNDRKNELVLVGILEKGKEEKKFQVRVVKEGKILSRLTFSPIDSDPTSEYFSYTVKATWLGNKGFKPPIKIIRIGFVYEACDYPNGDVLLVWDGKNILYGMKTLQSSNEYGYTGFEYIFPDEKNGKENQIVIKTETGEYDEKGNIKKKSETLEYYLWDGKKFKKIDQ
ncbi:MAG: SH3 domain-containing protein [Spirochaetes bacterium]|nr:SH3 domain-containing protein [Spirochaetota bacterium]